MNDTMFIFVLRLMTSFVLMWFIGTIGYMIWRDFRQSAVLLQERTRRRGYMVVMESTVENLIIGQTFPLSTLTTLGRSPTNTIPIAENYVSNEHALVQWREGQWWLEDLRSSNGTLLNDLPVLEPVVVSSGDVIGIGSVRLRLELQ